MSRRDHRWNSRKQSIRHRRETGWDMNLYRNPENGKIAGVCAGIADHFDFAPWVIRLIFIGCFFIFGSLAVIAYIAGWVLMSPRQEDSLESFEYDENRHSYQRKNMFKHTQSPSTRLKRAQDRIDSLLHRVANIEAYVTSRQFELNRKFAEMEKQSPGQ